MLRKQDSTTDKLHALKVKDSRTGQFLILKIL